MAAPSSSGLTQLFESAQSDWQAIAVANAVGGALSVGTGAGIDGDSFNQCVTISNFNGGHVGGSHYSLYSNAFSSIDLSGDQQALWFHTRPQGSTFTILSGDADAIQVALFSGAGTSNWAKWNLGGSEDAIYPLNNSAYIRWRVPQGLRSPDFTGGTFDATDVTGVAFLYKLGGSGSFNFTFYIDQPVYVNGPVQWLEGDGTTVGSFQEYFDLHQPTSGQTYHSDLLRKSGGFLCAFPVQLNPVQFSDTRLSFTFAEQDDLAQSMNTGYYSLEFNTSSSLSMSTALFLAEGSLNYDLTITNGGVSGCTFANLDDVAIAGGTITGGLIDSPTNVSMTSALLVGPTISNVTNPIEMTGDLAANSIFLTDSDINITYDVGDYSDITATFTANNSVNLSPTTNSGTYNFSGWENTGFSTNFDIPSGNTNDATVTLDPTFTATRTDPTTGGGEITLDNATTVTVQVEVFDQETGLPLQDARVRLLADTGGPATVGTVILEGLTNASGILNTNYTFTGNQPVTGTVRKASTDPFFKAGSLGGSITSSGYNVPVNLLRD